MFFLFFNGFAFPFFDQFDELIVPSFFCFMCLILLIFFDDFLGVRNVDFAQPGF